MIEVSFDTALFIYLVLWLVMLATLWRREIVRLRRNEWQLSNSRLFHCDQCHHSFIIGEPVNLTRCPRCNAVCTRRRRRDLE